MKHLLLFKKGPIDRASTVEDSAGETVDFLAVPFDNLVNISATYGEIVLYIREANSFENSKANLAQVTLAVEPTREIETVKQLWAIIRQDNPTGYIDFNSPIRNFPVDNIREIVSIKRFTTERFTTSGGGSLPTGGVEDQVLTKQSATDEDADWEYPHTLYVTVKNVSGGTLPKGTPVHANDVTGNVADVIAADASNSSAMPCTYVLNEEIANNAQGIAILTGTITGVDTSSFSPGDVVYVASGGGFTNVKPTGTNLIQNLGVVTKSNASTGSGVIYGTGRSNDVPNLTTGKFFIGSASNSVESAYTLPTADGSANQFLKTDGAGAVTFTGITQATGTELENLVEDTTPQLGGNLDVNGNKIVSTSNGDIDIEPNGTGDVLLGNFKFDADQSVGAGQDNYLLTYDNSSGKISLEAAAAAGGG